MKTAKHFFLALFFSLFLVIPGFAQGVMPSGMQTLADEILGIFTGDFVRVILIIFLCATAIVFAYNKDNEKMKRNCIAIGVSIAIIIAAQSIVDAIMSAAKG